MTGINGTYRIQYVIAPLFHIVVGADGNGFQLFLPSDDVLERCAEFLGQSAMGDNHETDHACINCLSSKHCTTIKRSPNVSTQTDPAKQIMQ